MICSIKENAVADITLAEENMKKLEELLNLPDTAEQIKKSHINERTTENKLARQEKEDEENSQERMRKLAELDKISAALPPVSGLGRKSDSELDDISKKAIQSYEDLMDLGMNVEIRYAGRLFEIANNMLKTGLDAKMAKIDSKLKMVDLQLKKEKLEQIPDQSSAKKEEKQTKTLEENRDYIVTDRNSLLEKLRGIDGGKNDENE